METVAWTTQKCAMHRFLWCPHKSLHEPRKGAFELNDLSGLFFGAISIALIAWNAEAGGPLWALSVGLARIARAPEKGAARRNQTLKKSQPHSKRRTIDGTKPRGLL